MKELSCFICSSDDYTVKLVNDKEDYYANLVDKNYNKKERKWVQSKKCNFIYQNPQLDSEDIDILYRKFRDFSLRNETPDDYFERITSLPENESENLSKVNRILHNLPKLISREGKILDIGCGGGVFLYTFLKNANSWKIYGIEPTISFAELASKRLKSDIKSGNYKRGVCGKNFDLIILNHVIEHTVDPKLFLSDIYDDLKPGGYLYLECPHESDFDLLPKEHDRFKLQHNWYFGFESFIKLVKKTNFDIILLEKDFTIRKRNNLVVILRK